MKVSNGYVMGFLCGYLRDQMHPGVLGYHKGYTTKEAAQAVKPVQPAKAAAPEQAVKPCECKKPECPKCAEKANG